MGGATVEAISPAALGVFADAEASHPILGACGRRSCVTTATRESDSLTGHRDAHSRKRGRE